MRQVRWAIPILRKRFEVADLLRFVIADELEWSSAQRMSFLRLVTVLGNDGDGNEVRQQPNPRLCQRDDDGTLVERFDTFNVTPFLIARAFEKTGGLREVA